jgi:hypothetical protein
MGQQDHQQFRPEPTQTANGLARRGMREPKEGFAQLEDTFNLPAGVG